MKYYTRNNSFDLNEEELESSFLGEGCEGCCYKIGGDVFKIYKKFPQKYIISENDLERLLQIETERIVLPNDILYDSNGKYIGYISKYIEEEYYNFKTLKLNELIEEFKLLESDTKILTDNNIEIYDLSMDNTIISNGFYLSDVGSFKTGNNRFIEDFNRCVISQYEVVELLFNIFNFTKKEELNIKKICLEDDCFLSEILEIVGYDKEENAKKYFKNIAR